MGTAWSTQDSSWSSSEDVYSEHATQSLDPDNAFDPSAIAQRYTALTLAGKRAEARELAQVYSDVDAHDVAMQVHQLLQSESEYYSIPIDAAWYETAVLREQRECMVCLDHLKGRGVDKLLFSTQCHKCKSLVCNVCSMKTGGVCPACRGSNITRVDPRGGQTLDLLESMRMNDLVPNGVVQSEFDMYDVYGST
jgi:hypothetical protein